jgi:hypothetical protein
MQRKQQVGECWVCVIFFARVVVFVLCQACIGGSGASAPENFFFLGKCVTFLPHFSCCLDFCVHCWVVFRHMVFANGFLFSVKELGLLTNPGHWVRVLDVVGSYMYIVL